MNREHVLHKPASTLVERLAAQVKDRGWTGLVAHVRTVGVQRLHTLGERAAQRWRGPDGTLGRHELAELTVASGNVAHGVHFLSTPWAVLKWVHRALPADKHRFTFVDLGAGKGRAVLSAAALPYKRVIGVEFARELAATADANIRRAGHAGDRVSIVEGDATAFDLPEGPLVVFLFNPFGPPVLDQVIARIREAARLRSDPILVAYLNPVHAGRMTGLKSVPLALATRARFAALSPYRLQIYHA